MSKSKIQWTDQTWNPVTGCTPIATGCKYCYAKEMHRRLRSMGQKKYQHDFSEVRCHPGEIRKPLRWRKPRRVFVCSMSDLFHVGVTNSCLDDVWAVMAICAMHEKPKGHTFQILTKRPARMREYVMGINPHCIADSGGNIMEDGDGWWDYLAHHLPKPLPNVWIGSSASTQEDLAAVAPDLLGTPAATRFLSLEPLLGPLNIRPWISRIHWVIVGCESGPHRRPCYLEWIRDIRDQCVEAGVPLFVKQAEIGVQLVKMPEIDGVVWDQMPRGSR